MMATFLFLLVSFFFCAETLANTPTPRLVVLISYDQYRGDYLDNFRRFVGKRGFERMRDEGASFSRCMFTYANLMTGPGHATLMTGFNPNSNGVASNDFCDSETGTCRYCAEGTNGVLSPENLLKPTFGEMLRRTHKRSKTVAIGIKDRAAILMAGHNPTAVVWMDSKTQAFTTSKYYKTPKWLKKLNKRVRTSRHANAVWSATIPDSLDPALDNQVGEGSMSSGSNTFPYTVPPRHNKNFYNDYTRTPYSLRDLFDATKAVIEYENLGRDAAPDVLCVGVSTTDYLGHTFGPDSREVQELYVECDKQLGSLIDYLDKRVGREKYVLIVTADHGVAPIPEVIRHAAEAQKATVDAGRVSERTIRKCIDSAMIVKFGNPPDGKSWCREILEPNVYLSDSNLLHEKIYRPDAVRVAANALRSLQGIGICVMGEDVKRNEPPSTMSGELWTLIRNSYVPTRSGDLLVYPKQYWIFGSAPTTHGTPYEYDRHVVFMWMGGGIKPQAIAEEVSPVDIAPTLGEMFNVPMPGVDGHDLKIERAGSR